MTNRDEFPILVSFVLLWSRLVFSLEQTHLTDLREFRVEGLGARIAVPRNIVEDIMNNVTTGFAVDLSLPEPENDENLYDTRRFGELYLAYSIVHDHTLSGLSCKMKDRVSVSYRLVSIGLPFVTGGGRGLMILIQFTDSNKAVLFPYNTNRKDIIHIDEIEETEDGRISLRHGNDVMVMNTQRNDTCRRNERQHVGEDFDKISGKSFTTTNYPRPFDWGCDMLGDEVDFCDILKQNENGLKEAGSNVCTEMTITSQSKRCPTTLEIKEMTGFFLNELSFLSVPTESFESVWVVREHGGGIIFPCLTTN